ncbi:MAG: DUF2293 domain-containing protein [Notoacmeibacter sp.]
MSANPKRQKEIREAFTALFPLAPFIDAEPIREKAARKSMNGLTAEVAVWLSGIAHIRHEYTDYDDLLNEGYGQDAARFFVVDEINAVLTDWRASRFVLSEEDLPLAEDDQE